MFAVKFIHVSFVQNKTLHCRNCPDIFFRRRASEKAGERNHKRIGATHVFSALLAVSIEKNIAPVRLLQKEAVYSHFPPLQKAPPFSALRV